MIRLILLLISLYSFSFSSHAYKYANPSSWSNIKHIVLIMLENTNASNALSQPYLKQLSQTGAYLANYYAISHPSQPNYIALIAGSTYGIITDSDVTLNGMHLGDLLNAKGLTWKAYAEDLPTGSCFLGATSGNYARKHEPFISFRSVQTNPVQCAKIVPGTQFFNDLAANQLPTFSFYVPNIKDDGHDTGVSFADTWLKNTFGQILSNANILKDTLFIVTFDEDDYLALNNVYAAFIGAAVKSGAQSNVIYTHYSLLKTIEEIFQTGSLCQNDSLALPITDIWQ